MLDLRTAQPLPWPDHHVVGQRAKQHQPMLSLKALLIAFGETQSLLGAFQRGFDAAPALIVVGHLVGQLPSPVALGCPLVVAYRTNALWKDVAGRGS